jgi:hypothetical protein
MFVPEQFARFALVSFCVAVLATASAAAGKSNKKAAAEADEASAGKSLSETVKDAERIDGLLTFYRSPKKLYMQLPAELVDAPLGFSAVLVHAAGDYAMRGGAVETQLVRWKKLGRHVVLAKENLDFRSDPGSPLAAVIASSFPDSPVFAAKLIPLTDDPAPILIDAEKLFGPDLVEILPERSGFTTRPDDAVLVSLKAFADNVVARVSYSFRRTSKSSGPDAGGFTRFMRPGRLADPRRVEILVDYNFYRLPEDGYVPRRADERIGAMSRQYKDYTDVDSRDTLFEHLVVRWDVRKADPAAALSPPLEPITFYMDPSVPERWRPLVREGAEWWNTAFARVGIEGAVRVLDPPDDPDWDPANIEHSVIYWNLADNLVFSGAAGPSLVDPRTGKVLKANVYLNGEFFSFALNRYLVYAWWRAPEPGSGAAAIRARREFLDEARANPRLCRRAASFSSQMAFARLVLASRGQLRPGTAEADRFAREAFLELVAHEVGHALGFPHNWKASLSSSWEDVRDGNVTGRTDANIFSASVMDYNPIYLAPRGKPQGDFFMQELGPYDDLAVEYIYRPLEHLEPEQRELELDRIASRAEVEPGLIYDGGGLGHIDPTTNSDDYGDRPLEFAESRLRMIQEEVLPTFPELVLAEGHDYNLLRQALDSAIFSVAMDYIDMTARHVGGQILLRRVAGSRASAAGPPPITPVPADVQRRALEILDRYVFMDGAFALPPESMARFKADLLYDWNYPWRYESDYDLGGRIAGLYEAAFTVVLEPQRLSRILDNERRLPAGADRFTLPELFERLESSAFDGEGRELSADRRALQRALVARLIGLALEPEKGTPAEGSQLAAASLRSILARIEASLPGADRNDGYARAHMEDLAARATRALDASIALPVQR